LLSKFKSSSLRFFQGKLFHKVKAIFSIVLKRLESEKMKVNYAVRFFLIAILFSLLRMPGSAQTPTQAQAQAPAQAPTGNLHGQVTDPTGAAITGATAVMTPDTGSPVTATSNGQGYYEFKSLPPGKYSLTVVAQGFNLFENDNVVITEQALRLNIPMTIEVAEQKVNVSDTAPTVDVNPANNAGAIVISSKELDALPDDPDELLSDLQALAGPSAGPSGGQMYVDGFTAGQLPPKSSIREIRINQNPFSAEYDKLGYGRIEIFTKPGTDKYHGQFLVDGNDWVFNTANPFAGSEPPYDSQLYNGSIGGAIRKNASFFFSIDRRNVNDIAPVYASVLDPTLTQQVNLVESIPNPHQRTNFGPRIDWAPTKNNTITARYQYYRDTETNNGIGQFSLPSQGYYSKTIEDTVQISDTQVIGAKVVNETRFQFLHDLTLQNASDLNPAVNVIGNFTGGGSGSGNQNDDQNHYELQNYTSVIHGNHIIKFGARIRGTTDDNYSTSGFNGTFTFSSLLGSPSLTAACQSQSQNPPCPISLAYALGQIQNPSGNGGAPPYATQLTYTTGSPNATVNYFDAEPYVQDDWRVRPNITISSGLRFETQNNIHDKFDWAPRFGFAWGVNGRSKPPIVVIRGGYGIFYDRFQLTNILQQDRLNGITQQQFIVNNPTCFPGVDVPFTNFSSCGAPTSSISAVYQINPRLHAPYTMQGAIGVERQVTKNATLSVIYLNSRGFDQFLTINAAAPYPGTSCYLNPSGCPTVTQNEYRYVSEANFSQNQLITNTNVRIGAKVQMFGWYTLNYAKSDTAGIGTFPSNSYNISQDYGRASFDVRHRFFLGGSIALPYLVRLSPFMVVQSGSPFNITSPYDLNGDAQYNDRPGLVSKATCPLGTAPQGTIYCTPLGTFDATGATGTLLPINYATAPNHFVMNLRLSKTFGIGPKTKTTTPNTPGQGPGGGGGGGRGGGGGPRGPIFGGGGGGPQFSTNSDRRYNLTLSVSARNVFNNVNVANPNATLGTKFFDLPNALQGGPFSQGSAANRRIDFIASFSF
jgi:hypothetical protein